VRVIAIDPGGITGYCYARIEKGYIVYHPFQVQDDVEDLWDRLFKFKPDCTVIEDFEFRSGQRRTGLDLFPVQLIGVVNLYHNKFAPQARLFVQKAATGKAYYTDQVLKRNGLYIRGCAHGMDASRHLLQWFTFGAGHKFQGRAPDFAKLALMSDFV
jgi:hypothetical protein